MIDMCMEDIEIGRAANSGQINRLVGTTSLGMLSSSLDRISVVLCAPLSGTLTYTTDPVAIAGNGIVLVAGSPPVLLAIKDHGSMVRDAWNVIAAAGNTQAAILYAELPHGWKPNTI